jgi:hypothetical protein
MLGAADGGVKLLVRRRDEHNTRRLLSVTSASRVIQRNCRYRRERYMHSLGLPWLIAIFFAGIAIWRLHGSGWSS